MAYANSKRGRSVCTSAVTLNNENYVIKHLIFSTFYGFLEISVTLVKRNWLKTIFRYSGENSRNLKNCARDDSL